MDQRRGAERSLKLLIPSRYRREWQTALLHIKWKERGEGGRRKGRGRRKAGRDTQGEEAVRGSLCRSTSQGKDRQQQPLLALVPTAQSIPPPPKGPWREVWGLKQSRYCPGLTGELQALPHASAGPRPGFAL